MGNLKVAFCMPDLKGASAVALQMDKSDDLVTLSEAKRVSEVKLKEADSTYVCGPAPHTHSMVTPFLTLMSAPSKEDRERDEGERRARRQAEEREERGDDVSSQVHSTLE
jgi:hypothetical protein